MHAVTETEILLTILSNCDFDSIFEWSQTVIAYSFFLSNFSMQWSSFGPYSSFIKTIFTFPNHLDVVCATWQIPGDIYLILRAVWSSQIAKLDFILCRAVARKIALSVCFLSKMLTFTSVYKNPIEKLTWVHPQCFSFHVICRCLQPVGLASHQHISARDKPFGKEKAAKSYCHHIHAKNMMWH